MLTGGHLEVVALAAFCGTWLTEGLALAIQGRERSSRACRRAARVVRAGDEGEVEDGLWQEALGAGREEVVKRVLEGIVN